jgi:DNA-binding transcriptional ArsR family regulator
MIDGPKRLAREKLTTSVDELRYAVITNLSFEPATAAELAAELDVPVKRIRYHLRRMRSAGLLEVKEKVRRRGVAENLYVSCTRRHLLDNGEAALLPPGRVEHLQARLLRSMFRETTEAVRGGTFSNRPGFAAIRFPLPLDEQGWREATDLHHEVIDRVLTAVELSRRRLEASGEKAIRASALTLFFERSPGGAR